MVKLAPHSEGLSSVTEVNHAVVHRFRGTLCRQDRAQSEPDHNVFLPGETSIGSSYRLKPADKIAARWLAIIRVLPVEESAEAIVVVSKSVNSHTYFWYATKNAASRCGRRTEPKKRKQPEALCEHSCDTLRGEPIGPVPCGSGLVACGSEPQQNLLEPILGFASNTQRR